MSENINVPILLLSESAQKTMTTAAQRAHPDETGGILIGVYLDGQPWVTTSVEIQTSDRGHHHYKIPGGTTQPAVHAARTVDPRLGYLGDWHSHPRDVGPSPTDLVTLTFISVKNTLTPNPTLVVVRRTANGYVLDARRIGTFAPRACTLRMTGNLPPELSPST